MSKINLDLVEPLELNNDSFTMDEGEKALLNGTYSIKQYSNPHPDLNKIMDEYYNQKQLFHAKQIYMCGNILYKADEPHIEDMIDLMIRCTYAIKLPNFVDISVHKKTQMRRRTKPTKEVIFRYEGKLYILYGRYIYGYDKPYVSFLNEDPKLHKNSDEDDDDDELEDCSDVEERERDGQISRDEIIVPTVKDKERDDIPMDDYNYAFSIVDEKTGILNAFAIYR